MEEYSRKGYHSGDTKEKVKNIMKKIKNSCNSTKETVPEVFPKKEQRLKKKKHKQDWYLKLKITFSILNDITKSYIEMLKFG